MPESAKTQETKDISAHVEPEATPTPDQGQKPAVPASKRKYTHLTCDTTHEISDEDFADMRANPDRYNGLPCLMCGSAPFRIGEDGEMVWAGSKNKVVPQELPA